LDKNQELTKKLNKMVKKKYIILFWISLLAHPVLSQPDTLYLRECYAHAKELSPLKRQELLNKNIFELNLRNHQSNYLPSFSMSGKASYQSEVITIPGTAMIQDYPKIPKEQFQVSLDINQQIYDGGLTNKLKNMEESQYAVNEAELETQLYAIHQTINELFFSILNLQEQKKILNLTLKNIKNQKKIVEASVDNGIMLASNLFQIEKQILILEQDILSVDSDKHAFLEMLSEWTGLPVTSRTVLTAPGFLSITDALNIHRPENELFQAQRSLLESQRMMTNVERTPRVSAFIQGGIGQPNPMNFFEVDPSLYYILGIRLNWSIYDWGNASRKKQVFQLQQDRITIHESDFNRKINIGLARSYADINKLEEIIEKDRAIISLQKEIVQTAFSELQQGVITTTEYLTELNALTEAEIKKVLHETQLSSAYTNIYITTGNKF
jgi:outer membrane protein TolC